MTQGRRFELLTAAVLCLGSACHEGLAQAPATHPTFAAVGDTQHTIIGQVPLHAWALEYREWRTELLECLYGRVAGDTVLIRFAVLANVRPSHSTLNTVTPDSVGSCLAIASEALVGMAHSHPADRPRFVDGQYRADSDRFHPDPALDLCYESFIDVTTFVRSGLPVSVVICGVGRIYVLRRGRVPNAGADVCAYDPEEEEPELHCGAKGP